MPLVKIQTNQSLDGTAAESLAKSVTSIVASALGKPESVTMAIVSTDEVMTFGGNAEPTTLFEIEALGSDDSGMQALAEGLSELAEDHLEVPGARVFIKLTSVPRGYWGQDRKVF